jgi:hypothetical protein
MREKTAESIAHLCFRLHSLNRTHQAAQPLFPLAAQRDARSDGALAVTAAVNVAVTVAVTIAVTVAVTVAVTFAVIIAEIIAVTVAVTAAVNVAVTVAVTIAVTVAVTVAMIIAVTVAVTVATATNTPTSSSARCVQHSTHSAQNSSRRLVFTFFRSAMRFKGGATMEWIIVSKGLFESTLLSRHGSSRACARAAVTALRARLCTGAACMRACVHPANTLWRSLRI